MIKKLALLLVLAAANSFSQEIVTTQQVKLQRDRSAFQVVDTVASQVAVFVSDKLSTRAILLDSAMKITDSLTTARPDNVGSPGTELEFAL